VFGVMFPGILRSDITVLCSVWRHSHMHTGRDQPTGRDVGWLCALGSPSPQHLPTPCQIYMHESSFLTKSLFAFLLRLFHTPAHAPNCTQIALPPPYPNSLHHCSATRVRFNGAKHFLGVFWGSHSAEAEKGQAHTPESR
jgi:hypothetical protein